MSAAEASNPAARRQSLLGRLNAAEAALRANLDLNCADVTARVHMQRALAHIQEAAVAVNGVRRARTAWQLVEDLAQVGAPLATTTSQALNEMSRQSARMAIRFYVDGLGDLCRSLQMDVLRATILMNIVRRNHSAFEAGLGQDVDAISLAQWFTDPMRRAVSTYCVAKTLRLPYETVRRHCRALQDQGAVETDDKGGLVVTGRLLETQIGRDVAKSTWVATRSFMNSLAQLGRDMAKPAYA